MEWMKLGNNKSNILTGDTGNIVTGCTLNKDNVVTGKSTIILKKMYSMPN